MQHAQTPATFATMAKCPAASDLPTGPHTWLLYHLLCLAYESSEAYVAMDQNLHTPYCLPVCQTLARVAVLTTGLQQLSGLQHIFSML
jgi:hypothetical protein